MLLTFQFKFNFFSGFSAGLVGVLMVTFTLLPWPIVHFRVNTTDARKDMRKDD